MKRTVAAPIRLFIALCAAGILQGPAQGADADSASVRGAVGGERVFLSPSRQRQASGSAVVLNVLLDFRSTPTLGGGIAIGWDPAVFPVATWTYATSTINDDPALRGPAVIQPGSLTGVFVEGAVPLTTPGTMGTLTLTPATDSCDSSVSLSAGPAGWFGVSGGPLPDPAYGQARVGVGDAICTARPIDPADAQMRARCIARNNAGSGCPGFPSWRADPLFAPLSIRQDLGIVSPLAPHMARYCVYQRLTSGSNDTDPFDCGALQRAANNASLPLTIEPSVMAAGAQGPLGDVISPEFESHFFEQVGKPLGDLPSPSPGQQLWVVSLDTASRTGFDPIASHGPIIARIVSELTEIATAGDFRTLALPFRCFDDDDCLALCGAPDGCPAPIKSGEGGFKGTPDSVAQGLHTAIGLWAADGGAIQRMVFNMSLGWPAEFNSVPGATLGYLAFVDALKEASCLGTLVIASAGNTGAGPVPSQDLLFPAAESLTAAPTLQECQQLGYFPDPGNFPPASGQPLVYAVGATRSDGRPLLTRIDGEPELVAYGDHATALTSLGEGVLTGTSVASAVASATAGLLWAYDLDVPAWRLMEILYESAADLGREANVCLGPSPCGNVRRVSVCAALNAFCDETGSTDCPTPAEVNCPDIDPVQLTLPDSFFDNLDDVVFAGAQSISVANFQPLSSNDLDDACNHNGTYKIYLPPGQGLPLNPCPQDQFFDAQSQIWAEGQPEGQSCETCGIQQRSPARLYAELRADFGTGFSDPTLSDATLICRNQQNGNEVAFRLQGTFQPGALLLVTDIDPVICPGDDLRLAFSVSDDASESPVAFVQQLYVFRPDQELDGVPDFRDNCVEVDNPDQRDTNGDGYGNICDPDLNNDLFTNFIDLQMMKQAFFTNDPDADLDGSGLVNFQDLQLMSQYFFGPPGPSGVTP